MSISDLTHGQGEKVSLQSESKNGKTVSLKISDTRNRECAYGLKARGKTKLLENVHCE
jgi:hypothetical protein